MVSCCGLLIAQQYFAIINYFIRFFFWFFLLFLLFFTLFLAYFFIFNVYSLFISCIHYIATHYTLQTINIFVLTIFLFSSSTSTFCFPFFLAFYNHKPRLKLIVYITQTSNITAVFFNQQNEQK